MYGEHSGSAVLTQHSLSNEGEEHRELFKECADLAELKNHFDPIA